MTYSLLESDDKPETTVTLACASALFAGSPPMRPNRFK
jgi:hypothetical protein